MRSFCPFFFNDSDYNFDLSESLWAGACTEERVVGIVHGS